ncbi:MAG: 50S ribosome-binding GTPase [Deltaproteobacteria bacterium]|jgi:sulfate adenylyltransferase large subunit|nr:50S ribosome-binding GTPase [Deltaproteobacteria bacterium]
MTENANDLGRNTLKLVVVGHVDHGKSTVIGRLLYDTDSVNQGLVEKVRAISAETGQPFEFAFLLDAFEEERKQGITIDTTQLRFKTKARDYVIIDAPGHKEFLKNMISGASDAEAAFLVVDAGRGVEEQSRRHAHTLSLLGVEQIALIVNKMDLVSYDEKVYNQITKGIQDYLLSLGLRLTLSIPLAALLGDNVASPSKNFPWHKGPTLLEALDALTKEAADDSGLRLPLQDVYKFDDRRILAGRIESGQVKVGDRIVINPGHKLTTVVSLAAWLERDIKEAAKAGESVGLIVEDEYYNRRGEVISLVESPPIVSDRFKASIFWMGKKPLIPKRRYKLKLATSETEAEITEINHLIDSDTLAEKPSPGQVGLNEVAAVEIALNRPIPLDLFVNHKATGRFVLQDGYDVVGGGIVASVEERPPVHAGFAKGVITARCELFEEYFYHLSESMVNKIKPPKPHYAVGDKVPLRGRSFLYPDSFDIVVFRDLVAIKIRQGEVADIVTFNDYAYAGLPLINGRGFGVLVHSEAEWLKAQEEFAAMTPENEGVLAGRWLDFNAYRHIPIGGDDFSV